MPSDTILVFDPHAIRAHRRRALRAAGAEFLFDEIAERLLDRLDDIERRFPFALDLGTRGGVVRRSMRGRGGIVDLVELDGSASAPGLVGRE